ncbi:MAG TPA: hypothetical protein VEV87_03235 [Chitinophagaceae bacterium]|nr:hypothetical protein [Chitinophagaceae bacterium]
MSLAIVITLNIIWIPIICLISVIVGFIARSIQINKLRKQVYELEKLNVLSDAEILELQKENGQLQEQLKNLQVPVPVIPITTKENPEKLPDTNSRKIMLEKTSAKQHP